MKRFKGLCVLVAMLMLLSTMLSGCGLIDAFTNDDLSLGKIEGSTYINEYVGFAIDLSSGWTLSSADELQRLPDQVLDQMNGSDLTVLLDQYEQIFDLMAERDSKAISVNYTKLPTIERIIYAFMSEEMIVDTLLSQEDMLTATYKASGIYPKSFEKVEVEIMGKTHYALHMKATAGGDDYYTLQLFFYQKGSYGVSLTLASFDTDSTYELAKLVTAL